MYTENNNGGLIKSIILKLLFVALFIFLLLWLYPMPNTKPFYDSIFNDNINLMKEVAEDYYTVQRLPEKIGEEKKLTLKEMLDMKLLLPFVDKNGEYCDVEKSYVQVTKLENDEYELKVSLSCKDQTDYIIEYLGCHDLCANGECKKEVQVLEYKFERELFKGRKKVTVNTYEYEYTKTVSEAYTTDKNVTYYKGRKQVSDDTYKYKYTKDIQVPVENEVKTTYYKGRKANPVYSYEYVKTTTSTISVPTTTTSAPKCTTYYNQTSIPANAANNVTNITKNTGTIEVADGYEYGEWKTVYSFTSTTPRETYSKETEQLLANGYELSTSLCTTSSCPKAQMIYKYIVQIRTKKAKTKTQEVTTYTYQICTPGETTTTYTTKNVSNTETIWSTTNPGSEWSATGKSKVDSYTYSYTDWVTTLPAGYEQIDTKTETTKQVSYKTETKVEWSTDDLTKSGWTKTEEKELVKAKEYDYTGWLTTLPAGYEQIDKKQVTEKVVQYKNVEKTEWSTEDLTQSGWTKTGESKKTGTTTKYIYTDWVTTLPAGYEQCDKKVETKWSTEKTISGWKIAKDTRVKED